jgi:hypothetical protein
MSFARWENKDACILEQKGVGHDQESAKKICEGIQVRAEKGELYKSADQQNYDVICKSDTELVIGGFASWELVDPENDLITAEAQAKYLQKLFKLPVEYRNIMVGHSNFKIGEPILKYTTKDGGEYFSHVNEKGLYLISKIRNDNFKTTQKWREKILKGEMSMYSIAGLPLETESIKEGATTIRKVHDIEPWEITVCEKGVNPKAEFKVLAKEKGQKTRKTIEKYDVLGKMTWEECIAQASADPDVDDPEALCGWLRRYGPNAKSQEKPIQKPCSPEVKACVEALLREGKDEDSAWAICNAKSAAKPSPEAETILEKYGFNKARK